MDKHIKLTFLGASETVTGSCFHLKINGHEYLIDCGLFQGPSVFEKNFENFSFDPKQIEAVFLTHGHIDHSGLLPKLVRFGFSGEIFATSPTILISNSLLIDSAKVQEQNFRFKNEPKIYDLEHSLQTLNLFHSVKFDNEFQINDMQITFRKASHILGASSIEIYANDKRLVFSGDIGRRNPTIIEGYGDISRNIDYVIMEALYGQTIHPKREDSLDKLAENINITISRNGNVIIPVFALHRSQEFLYFLKKLKDEGKIDKNVQIYFDSPLGLKVLNLYTEHSNYFSPNFQKINDPFGIDDPNTHLIRSNKQSISIRKKKGVIIVAGGGMLDGGRAVGHLFSNLSDSKSSVLIVGYQADGTLGREIISSPSVINDSQGKKVKVKIQIKEIYGFSAHGDQDDLLWWLSRFDKQQLKKIFLTHAEIEQSSAFKSIINSDKVIIPKHLESFDLI